MSQQQLESLAESIHKYDKYTNTNNYVLKPPQLLEEHLAQIKRQLFALCFNVEIFVNRPFDKTSKCEMDPEVWGFLHEVVLRLPRTLEVQDIKEARAELYESLYHTERERPPTVTELVNPGADIPEPLMLQKQTQKDDGSVVVEEETPIEIHAVPESNGYTPTPFALQQTSVVATDGTEYIVEFIPDERGEEAEVERELGGEAAEPAPKAKAKGKAAAIKKAAAKGKAKAAAAAPKKKTAERKTAAPAKSTKAAAAGRAAARAAAKARAAASAKQRSSSPLSVPDSPTPAAKPKGRRAAVPAASTTQDAAEPAPAPAAAPSKGKKRAAEDDEDQPVGIVKKARRGGKTQEAAAAAEPGPVRRSVRRKA